MTASEQLRLELTQCAPFTKNDLINTIVTRIRRNGRACFICDRHIERTEVTGHGNTIRLTHEHTAIDYAREEGFRVSYDRNTYGVRYIIFTL